MGTYVNSGNIAFQEAVNSRIYIDKSELILYTNSILNTTQKNICVSRPRRFGKSMATEMLVAYYSKGCDSAKLFSGKKAKKDMSFLTHLNHHNVIHLDIQQFLESERDLDIFIKEIEYSVIEELMEVFPECQGFDINSRLKTVLNKIFNQTNSGFIFIIDEWDCVFRLAKNQKDIQKEYLDFLRGLFKGQHYVDMAYMTGILPIKKYGDHSAINIFDEYSMISPKNLGKHFGFTEEEVQKQCVEHELDFAKVKEWYDGYQVGKFHIYNPKSVSDVLTWKEFQSYWTGTETYEALKIYIDMNFDGLKEAIIEMLSNGHCIIDPSTFQNDMTTFQIKDDVLTLLVHLGYLTYNKESQEVSIPNQEVAQEFMRVIKVGGWEGLVRAIENSEDLLKKTWMMDNTAVADGIAKIHQETASMLKYNNENSLTCVILMAYYSARIYYMNPIMELPSGKGFADVVYLPKRNADYPALIIELKWDKSAEGAIAQIKNKEYTDWIKDYSGDILLIGVNYNTKDKKHECTIEKWRKEL